jgi:hypothetical protein
VEAHRLFAGPDGGSKGEIGSRVAACDWRFTRYKKGLLHTGYMQHVQQHPQAAQISTISKRHVGFDVRLLKSNLRPFMAF